MEEVLCYNITGLVCFLPAKMVFVEMMSRLLRVTPKAYAQWRHCITVDCGLELSPAYIAQRLGAWRDAESEQVLRFRRLDGDAHWLVVLAWFALAEHDLSAVV